MKETLSRRDRVLRAIERRPVDRTPIDLGAHYSTGISAFAYQNLRDYLGLPTKKIDVPDTFQFLARVDLDVLERFHCDCILSHPGWPKTQTWKPRDNYSFEISAEIITEQEPDGAWLFKGKNGGVNKSPAGGFFFDGWGFDPWPSDKNYCAETARYTEYLYKETDFFTLHMEHLDGFFYDNPDYLVDIMLEPEKVTARCEEGYRWNIYKIDEIVKHCKHYVQGVCFSCDLGTQRAPFINPATFADMFAPWLKKTITHIRNVSDYKVFFHTCGAMEPFIPILIDCGVDIINPVQVSCENMEPFVLKEKYGDKICFWGGGCDTHGAFGTGTPDEVRANVKHLMSALAPNSGFVFNQVHNIMGNVKPENVVAMFDTAYEESFKYGTIPTLSNF